MHQMCSFAINKNIAELLNPSEEGLFSRKQFSETLYRSDFAQEFNARQAEINDRKRVARDKNSSKENNPSDASKEEEDEKELEEADKVTCGICSKSFAHPSDWQGEYIKNCINTVKKRRHTGHFRREMITSHRVSDHCITDVLNWSPHFICGGVRALNCWNKNCSGSNERGSVSVETYETRVVEGIESQVWVIFPKFNCKSCSQYKSSLELDALLDMGVPLSVIRECPVVPLHHSACTVELADLIMLLTPTAFGEYIVYISTCLYLLYSV
jgi:hypothetical protein